MRIRGTPAALALAVLTACSPQAQPAPIGSPPSPAPASAGVDGDWPAYHRDAARTGFAPTGPDPGAVRRLWTTGQLDGAVFAEPLVMDDRVLVATEGDSIYALDGSTGAIVWRVNLGTPVPGGDLPCGNVNPVGITGTPVIDPAAGLIYAVAFVQPGRHELAALELATGKLRFRQPVDPPRSNPRVQNQRGALAFSRGMVYIAFGGRFGDCGDYWGWVAGVPAQGGPPIFYQVPAGRRAGIWAPPGPAVDGQGNLFVSTGNGDSVGSFDHGNSVIKLSPDLRELDFFAPTDWARLNRQDLDLGSLGPALLDQGLVFQAGKAGVGYLLRTDRLGGIGGQAFQGQVCGAVFGGAAYAAPLLYVPCTDGLRALRIDSRPSFSVAWQGPRFRGEASPIVAANTVWAIDNRAGRLYALDAGTGRLRFQEDLGRAEHFATPTVSGRRLFVPADHRVIAFTG